MSLEIVYILTAEELSSVSMDTIACSPPLQCFIEPCILNIIQVCV
jgi:hypothetical protein